ncbi:DUF5050 domain-containing protein [Clostridium butyricum]|uniref:DUF5050 domain-containing protein n=1 Tax=Clostridium butyricum TaxID=1492 RepID=UPI001CA9F91F|nr:DUF5050 domain-containing protein [Clostridium butyricum]MBZ0312426.1 DUF5050 domain-containing protein [Clostridium butyricum]
MAKKIRFPLIMKDGIQVRTIEELRENFDLEKVIEYFLDGKLITWVKDRDYKDKANELEALNIHSSNFKKSITKIFDININQNSINIEKIEHEYKRKKELKEYIEDQSILNNIENVAFNQKELDHLIRRGINTIYIFKEEFLISLSNKNINYIGIGNPILKITSDVDFDLNEECIRIKDCRIIFIGKGKNTIKDKYKFKLEISKENEYVYDLVRIAEEQEEVVESYVVDFVKSNKFIFYLTNDREIKQVSINNINNKKILYKNKSDCLGWSRIEWICKVGERIFCLKDRLIIKLSKGVIFSINYDGEDFYEIVHEYNSKISEIFILENYIFYRRVDYNYLIRVSIETKEKLIIEKDILSFSAWNNRLYYIKYEVPGGTYSRTIHIMKCNLDGTDKIIVKNDYGKFSIYGTHGAEATIFEIKNNKLIYNLTLDDASTRYEEKIMPIQEIML